MSISVKCLVVESFRFNDKSIRAFYIKDVGQCLISQDVYTAVGYDKENGVKTMQQLVPEKYKMRLGHAMIDMKEVDQNVHLHPDTALLKEPGLYRFLLRCKRDGAEPFMEWFMETVLPWELRKLASTIEEKDTKPANDKFHGLPYYIARIQRHKRYVKLRWFDQHFPDHEVIVEIGNPNSIYAFNSFEEEGHTERKCNYLRLIGLTQEELNVMGLPAILDDEEEKNFLCLITGYKNL